jgi:hypothetical protein
MKNPVHNAGYELVQNNCKVLVVDKNYKLFLKVDFSSQILQSSLGCHINPIKTRHVLFLIKKYIKN